MTNLYNKPGIYSIGYGNRSYDTFVKLLLKYEIKYLIDVRSRPYSKFNIDFTKEAISALLRQDQIHYIFMGDQLGGLPEDESCYTDGRVDYNKCMLSQRFISGIMRLKTAWEKELTVAIMCSESKPHECHRSKLLGEMLKQLKIELLHIDENENVVTQTEVINRILDSQLNLFDENKGFVSRKRYDF